jgi:DNA-binding transcriptional ArsR family regulator
MRPLYHPPVDEITVQGILYALSDPVRIRIYAELLSAECSRNCSTFLEAGNCSLPKSTLSQHIKVLREAGLIRSERQGVEIQNRTRCSELKSTIFAPMISGIVSAYRDEEKRKLAAAAKTADKGAKRARPSAR